MMERIERRLRRQILQQTNILAWDMMKYGGERKMMKKELLFQVCKLRRVLPTPGM